MLFTISIAVLNTLVPLWLSHQQLPTWQVGMVSSSYFSGNLVGTLIAGRIIQQLGFNRSYYYSCILFVLATCGLMLSVDFWNWLGWRFFAGV
ncbi:MFS transporter, partial [Yersinia enterocolitica]